MVKPTGFVVAIDGPAGVGKSSVAHLIAQKLDFYYLNSGNFYRAITYNLLQQGLDPTDENVVLEVAKKTRPSIIDGRLTLDGNDIEDQLHTHQVDQYVAQHSAI